MITRQRLNKIETQLFTSFNKLTIADILDYLELTEKEFNKLPALQKKRFDKIPKLLDELEK